MSKQKSRIVAYPNFFQRLLQDPLRYLWGLGIIATVFVVLGLLLHFFWGGEPRPVPFIEGVQGPLRIRPATLKNQPPSRRIYGDLSLQAPQKTAESLLPPEEKPALGDESSLVPSPQEQSSVAVSPTVSSSPEKPSKDISQAKVEAAASQEKLPSLDELLHQVEEAIAEKKSQKGEKSA